MSKNNYHRSHFTVKIKFTTTMLINSVQQTFIECLLFTSADLRPSLQGGKIKEELSQRTKLNATNYRYLGNVILEGIPPPPPPRLVMNVL